MIKALLFDLSRTLLFPKDKNYKGGLNELHNTLSGKPNYNLFDYFEIEGRLLDFLKENKAKIPLYLFTSETIQDEPTLRSKLDDIFLTIYSAKKLGMSKKDPKTYKFIAHDVGFSEGEIVFIDDSVENIKAAKEAGLLVIQYTGKDSIKKLNNYLHP